MADRTPSRTDHHRHRLQAARTQAISALNRAARILEHEDPADPVTANFNPGGTSSSATSPVEAAALGRALTLEDHEPHDHTRDNPRRHLDRIVSIVEKHVAQLHEGVRALEATRTPDQPCDCCDDELATHDGLCVPCLDYQRAHGYPCSIDHDGNPTNAVHGRRPKLRWCDCPLECCPTGCPDKAAEGRKVSERCKSRMRRRNLGQPVDAEDGRR